ncbi:SDH family Clp fold serine proteinase [Thalassospira tepidiphila]|uniref:Serine protease n=2 Tax=Thalassospira tepidiphila TaxID=393657 RepID=A0A853L2Z1_9PROT|nr:hypothetical protein [Thalassospira tepidiphila]NJB73261.1 membrane-bound ClpP family serine protease [Thalassospira tepidiphila]OAZ11027.1 hypothetical protein TH4_05660 [Thalassospira tepidiphila MCCC 1A03514]
MPTWNEINDEIDASEDANAHDTVRQKYIVKLAKLTNRETIGYYSGFLQKRDGSGRIHPECAINDHDMNGFMAVIHGLERDRGLDLILHTPGGDIEATRSLVSYLHRMFGYDIRVIVPHIAQSAGTMISCAAKEIILGKHSFLGPTDPQINGVPAMGILTEIDRAITEIKENNLKKLVWDHVFSKFHPSFIMNCERAVEGTKVMVKEWLENNMFSAEKDSENLAKNAVEQLMNYSGTSGHNQHFSVEDAQKMGLKIIELEDDQDLQENVLSVHHSYMASFARSTAIKIIDNSIGNSWTIGNQ